MLAALHLPQARPELLDRLKESEAREALAYCDRSQLTLSVKRIAPDFLPHEMALARPRTPSGYG